MDPNVGVRTHLVEGSNKARKRRFPRLHNDIIRPGGPQPGDFMLPWSIGEMQGGHGRLGTPRPRGGPRLADVFVPLVPPVELVADPIGTLLEVDARENASRYRDYSYGNPLAPQSDEALAMAVESLLGGEAGTEGGEATGVKAEEDWTDRLFRPKNLALLLGLGAVTLGLGRSKALKAGWKGFRGSIQRRGGARLGSTIKTAVKAGAKAGAKGGAGGVGGFLRRNWPFVVPFAAPKILEMGGWIESPEQKIAREVRKEEVRDAELQRVFKREQLEKEERRWNDWLEVTKQERRAALLNQRDTARAQAMNAFLDRYRAASQQRMLSLPDLIRVGGE